MDVVKSQPNVHMCYVRNAICFVVDDDIYYITMRLCYILFSFYVSAVSFNEQFVSTKQPQHLMSSRL